MDVARSVPMVIDNADTYIPQVEDGCHVYGGAQYDEEGRYTWFVSGP